MPETFNTPKQVAVIGGTAGIGRAIALHLAELGANVLVVGRTFRDADHRPIRFIHADLSLMREARRIGDLLSAEPLDLLVMIAGIMPPPQREDTAEGLERKTHPGIPCAHTAAHGEIHGGGRPPGRQGAARRSN